MNCSRAIVAIGVAVLLIFTGLTGCETPAPTPTPADELPSTSKPDSLQPDPPSPQVETPENSESPSTITPETTEDDGIFIEGTLADEQLQRMCWQ
jgi:hypothetical protein